MKKKTGYQLTAMTCFGMFFIFLFGMFFVDDKNILIGLASNALFFGLVGVWAQRKADREQ